MKQRGPTTKQQSTKQTPAKVKQQKQRFWARHKIWAVILIVIVVAAVGTAVTIGIMLAINKNEVSQLQKKLAPFYDTTGLPTDGPLGEVVRQEPLGIPVEGGEGVRILYRTQQSDGTPTFSSGLVFFPTNPSMDGQQPIVAWAHGTLGMGDQCAPSRIKQPAASVPGLSDMLQKGWIVTATDYAGFGTPGTQGYLVGSAEAHDVLNSVRAARAMAKSGETSNQFAIWGHSQGGHSALFSANEANTYAPELQLVGTVAAAPAAELIPLLQEVYGTLADWVIGPLISVSWPAVNDTLQLSDVLTKTGEKSYERIAEQCIGQAAISGMVRNFFKQKFFSTSPLSVPAWYNMASEQTAPILTPSHPLFIVESTADKVVLPNTTALYIQQACAAGSSLSSLWIEKVPHQDIAFKTTQQTVGWMNDRFSGIPQQSTCSQPLPVQPASPPQNP